MLFSKLSDYRRNKACTIQGKNRLLLSVVHYLTVCDMNQIHKEPFFQKFEPVFWGGFCLFREGFWGWGGRGGVVNVFLVGFGLLVCFVLFFLFPKQSTHILISDTQPKNLQSTELLNNPCSLLCSEHHKGTGEMSTA